MGRVFPLSTCSASTSWAYVIHASPECIFRVLCRTAGGGEVEPLLQPLSKSILVLPVVKNLPWWPLATASCSESKEPALFL